MPSITNSIQVYVQYVLADADDDFILALVSFCADFYNEKFTTNINIDTHTHTHTLPFSHLTFSSIFILAFQKKSYVEKTSGRYCNKNVDGVELLPPLPSLSPLPSVLLLLLLQILLLFFLTYSPFLSLPPLISILLMKWE